MKPNVLVAGFPRCATTFLFNLLRQHKDIFIPEEKEINYLHKFPLLTSHPDLINPKFFLSKEWYYKKFNSEKFIRIDFSVMTSYDKTSSDRIKRELGDIKIIFIIRNKESHQESMKKTILEMGGKIRIDTSHYSNFNEYIKPYKKNFKDVLVISKEELVKEPDKYLREIFKFFGIKYQKVELDVQRDFGKKINLPLFKYIIFRMKRNLLKTISVILTFINGKKIYSDTESIKK